MENPDITITIDVVRGVRRVTDGVHTYWRDGYRIRWAAIHRPDNGNGGARHGAAASLDLAIEAAESSRRDAVGRV